VSRAAVVLAFVAGCGSEQAAPSAADAAPEAARDASRPDAAAVLPLPPLECEPNLPAIERGVFHRACSFENCHGDNGSGASLSFIEGTTAQQLIGVTAFTCPQFVRVVPGSPEQSFLWLKLLGVGAECGATMPWGFERLPDPILDCVRRWILELPAAGDAGLDSGE
jgi:hypothetical protein